MKTAFANRCGAVLAVGLALVGVAFAGEEVVDPFSPANQAYVAKPAPEVRPVGKLPDTEKKLVLEPSVTPATITRGEILTLTIEGTPAQGEHTYPITQRTPWQAQQTTFAFTPAKGFALLGGVVESEAEFVDTKENPKDPSKNILLELEKPFTWKQQILVLPDAVPGRHKLNFTLNLQVCNAKTCTPPTDYPYEIDLYVSTLPTVALSAAVENQLKQPLPPVRVRTPGETVSPPEKTPEPVVPLLNKIPEKAENVLLEPSISPAVINRGDVLTLKFAGTPKNGYHTYPILTREPRQNGLEKLEVVLTKGFAVLGPVVETGNPRRVASGLSGKNDPPFLMEFDDPFTWTQQIVVLPDAPTGPQKLRVNVSLQVCKNVCTVRNDQYEVDLTVSTAPPTPLSAAVQEQLSQKPTAPVATESRPAVTDKASASVTPLPDDDKVYQADLDGILSKLQQKPVTPGSTGLLAFVLAGVFWGGMSLVTPCVFPMIPITVSFFLHQSQKNGGRPIQMALIYSGTIIAVLTLAAMILLEAFRWLSLNPVMNFAMGALFIYFALSLFGMYEIELPQSLAQFTGARQERGGVVGTIFMALTFTILSFACVAPFLGGFGGTAAASGDITLLHRFLGGLAFATTFAAPFFVLALFPSLLKKMPKSGSWLNNVKVVMGFLELAAAFKFLRAGEIGLTSDPSIFSYDLVLGFWIALSVLCGCYLLAVYRLPHDEPVEHIAVPRLLLGAGFLGFAFYLLPALFRVGPEGEAQRPRGSLYAWVDSFLLPGATKSDLSWTGNLKAALDEARADARAGKPGLVFVDFTGELCVNCKYNEGNVFPKPDVKPLLQQYHRVQLFNDTRVPDQYYSAQARGDAARSHADAVANLNFQKKAFGTEQSPLYVILKPQADGGIAVVGQHDEGKINNEAKFVQFLQKPLEAK